MRRRVKKPKSWIYFTKEQREMLRIIRDIVVLGMFCLLVIESLQAFR